LAIQYADFAYCQQQWLLGDKLEALLDYWRRETQGRSFQTWFDHRYAATSSASQRGSARTRILGKSLSESLKTLSRRENVTLIHDAFGCVQKRCFIVTPGRMTWSLEPQ